jgi:molybdenum cofactor synthesis domain-containing protein
MRVAILTISDTVARSERDDQSGPAVRDACRARGWEVVSLEVAPDEKHVIEAALLNLAVSGAVDLVLTSGGTGVGPRDVTPEATRAVCKKLIPGLGEIMRSEGMKKTPRAVLSRGVAGVREKCVIVNLPGSPKGAVESLEAVADLLPHVVDVLHGARHDAP